MTHMLKPRQLISNEAHVLIAGSGASPPGSFARNAMFSSLFAVLEIGDRCGAWLSWSSYDLCSEGSELGCQSIGLACVKLCYGIYVVTRDNYHCCIYAGELALNSLVPWMFVKHYDLLSRYPTILHDALASVNWRSVHGDVIIVDFHAIVCCEDLNEL